MQKLEDLPYCAGCLHDFSQSQAPCAFICSHSYCLACLQRLGDGHGAYKCLFDGSLSIAASVHCDIELGEGIERARRGQEVSWEEISRDCGAGDWHVVTCRVAFHTAACPREDVCPFSHDPKSLKITQRFLQAVPAPCWECLNCQLTLSYQVTHCPVCDSDRDEQHSQRKSSIREVKSATNVTLDQSLVTEEERPKLKQVPASLSEQITPIEEVVKQEEPARSKCCELQ